MKKVLDKDLEGKVLGIITGAKTKKDAASKVVAKIKELQDSSGIKVCQNVSKDDLAYREVR